jgi:hypothetical protein
MEELATFEPITGRYARLAKSGDEVDASSPSARRALVSLVNRPQAATQTIRLMRRRARRADRRNLRNAW